MTETTNLGLPLVQAAQAQKHVTVNEALTRLDAMVQLRLMAVDAVTPPAVAAEGAAYALGTAPTGDWAGQGGRIAVSLDGLWHYVSAAVGWQAWDIASGVSRRFDGTNWVEVGATTTPGGAYTRDEVIEFDQTLVGAAVSSDLPIPANTQVLGVSARVISTLSGSGLTGWQLGVAGSENRYGSGLGTALNSWAQGLTGQPVTYYSDTSLVLTPEGTAEFAGGVVRLAIHLSRIEPPRAV